MRIGVKLPSSGPHAGRVPLAEAAQRAEEAGFDSVWVSDHVVMPRQVASSYPYSRDGAMLWNPDEPRYEALITMATAAAVTERVEIGVGVLIAPMRNPLLLAKQVATLDALSGGRITLGVGAGWLEEEFEALDAPFDTRGERLDEWIDIIRDCWRGTPRGKEYRHYRVPEGSLLYPTPAHEVSIIVGGMTKAALRRVARRGDGWFAIQGLDALDATTLRAGLETIEEEARSVGRPAPIRVVMRIAGPAEAVAQEAPALAAAGVTDLVVDVDWVVEDGARRTMETLAAS